MKCLKLKLEIQVRAELKTGKLGTPKRTGAIFDTGVSGKAVWPEIEKILVSYGFKNMTERKKDAEGNIKKLHKI
jgi:hypothetical protein